MLGTGAVFDEVWIEGGFGPLKTWLNSCRYRSWAHRSEPDTSLSIRSAKHYLQFQQRRTCHGTQTTSHASAQYRSLIRAQRSSERFSSTRANFLSKMPSACCIFNARRSSFLVMLRQGVVKQADIDFAASLANSVTNISSGARATSASPWSRPMIRSASRSNSFRALHSSPDARLVHGETSRKILFVVSPEPERVGALIATIISQSNFPTRKRVLLVDADLRILEHALSGSRVRTGLSSMFRTGRFPRISRTDWQFQPLLRVLPAGPLPPNPDDG